MVIQLKRLTCLPSLEIDGGVESAHLSGVEMADASRAHLPQADRTHGQPDEPANRMPDGVEHPPDDPGSPLVHHDLDQSAAGAGVDQADLVCPCRAVLE